MSKECIFTIVAKNYIGLGEILGKSLHQHNPDVDFKIVVADEIEADMDLSENVIVARDVLPYSESDWRDMAFKYNLTEFCTAIKPGMFKHFMKEGYEKVMYFDPDIYIYSSVTPIFETLNTKMVGITPHVCGIHINYDGEHPEWLLNCNGIFNFGFGCFSNHPKVINFLSWWEKRLDSQCFDERTRGEFTDQKWIDWIPALFDNEEVYVFRNLGMNLAPWNFFERKVINDNGTFYVTFRNNDSKESRKDKLIFVHYSGYDYKKLKQGIVEHKRMNRTTFPDLTSVLSLYGEAIKTEASTFDKFIAKKYSYGSYDNGVPIIDFHRRLYNGIDDTIRKEINPFETSRGSYYEQLKKNGLIANDTPLNVSKNAIPNMDGKVRILNKFYKFIYKLIGIKRYIPFVKSMYFYCCPEKHSFLINSKKLKKNRQ